MRPGTSGSGGGGGGGGSYTLDSGGKIDSGAFAYSHIEDQTAVVETHRFHQGHELRITERLRLAEDGKALIYDHEVVGPKGQADRHEVSFDVG